MNLNLRSLLGMALLAGSAAGAFAQGIFTCVDAKGRRLTSDRPIAECNDREQKELTPTGTVKRTLKPSLTAEETARQDARDKAEAEEAARLAEERRRDKALLTRFPNKAAHDKERGAALVQIGEVIRSAQKRLADLTEQRKGIDSELEFYRKDPSKVPAHLKRVVDENVASIAAQKRFIASQDEEKKRVNDRFDEELTKLQPLWAGQSIPASLAAASGPRPAAPAARLASPPASPTPAASRAGP